MSYLAHLRHWAGAGTQCLSVDALSPSEASSGRNACSAPGMGGRPSTLPFRVCRALPTTASVLGGKRDPLWQAESSRAIIAQRPRINQRLAATRWCPVLRLSLYYTPASSAQIAASLHRALAAKKGAIDSLGHLWYYHICTMVTSRMARQAAPQTSDWNSW